LRICVVIRVSRTRNNASHGIPSGDDDNDIVGEGKIVEVLQQQSLLSLLNVGECSKRPLIAKAQIEDAYIGSSPPDAPDRFHNNLVIDTIRRASVTWIVANHRVIETASA